ncbi:MAG: triose-phosphate isomerase [Candidatus Pacebacteria bacterium]|nr:triose-phosphate isomerase [Candidatus Paceibacterota bacterium]MDD4074164.1 triose-phosphate isomerase [Candidatus Paceibacterota bacterium]
MNKLIIANWKCNPPTIEEAKELFEKIKDNALEKNVVICPPSIFLSSLICEGIKFGVQNCFWKEKGAFTGEISPQMIKSLGVNYVIIGHSERRNILKETNEEIIQKINEAVRAGLTPIVCIGESKGEDTFEVLNNQIKDIDENIILAYEPLWAIGTGESAPIEKVKEVKSFLKDRKVLYGGSVNSQNAPNYLEITDGLLVGGASLNSEEFSKIILCDI